MNSRFPLLRILNTTTMIGGIWGYFIVNSITRPKSMLVVVFRIYIIRGTGIDIYIHLDCLLGVEKRYRKTSKMAVIMRVLPWFSLPEPAFLPAFLFI